jgi:excisionase family DNA binding protein
MDDLLTGPQAAALLGVTTETVRSLADRGALRYERSHGRRGRAYRLEDVVQLRAERQRRPERRGRKSTVTALLSLVNA